MSKWYLGHDFYYEVDRAFYRRIRFSHGKASFQSNWIDADDIKYIEAAFKEIPFKDLPLGIISILDVSDIARWRLLNRVSMKYESYV